MGRGDGRGGEGWTLGLDETVDWVLELGGWGWVEVDGETGGLTGGLGWP